MEIDVKIIAALIALSGIFITTLFGVVGYIFKLRQDRKKSTRTVLYLLLEIRHSLLKAVFNPILAAICLTSGLLISPSGNVMFSRSDDFNIWRT